jgi:hypothetical protein
MGDFYLDSQADVEAFDCTEVTGGLTIDGWYNPYGITDLSSLSGLTSVGGDLGIVFNFKLTSLSGLEDLISVEGSLYIWDNNKLTSLSGLGKLTSVGEDLQIRENDALASTTGLEELTSVGGNLKISDNAALAMSSGLKGLTSVGGGLYIRENDGLGSLTGLEKLAAVGGDVVIQDNDALVLLPKELASVGGDFEVTNNEALTECSCSLSGLIENEQFVGVGGTVSIHDNHAYGTCTSPGVVLGNPCEADLSVSVADTPDPVGLYAPITYTLTLANNGPKAAPGFYAQLALPPQLHVIALDQGCGLNPTHPYWSVVVCSGGELAAETNAVFTVTA